MNSSVVCGGTKINPGDIFIADDNGVVAIAAEQIDNTTNFSKERRKKDGVS